MKYEVCVLLGRAEELIQSICDKYLSSVRMVALSFDIFLFNSFRESLFNILSGLYAILLIVMGTTLPLAEIFASGVFLGDFEVELNLVFSVIRFKEYLTKY